MPSGWRERAREGAAAPQTLRALAQLHALRLPPSPGQRLRVSCRPPRLLAPEGFTASLCTTQPPPPPQHGRCSHRRRRGGATERWYSAPLRSVPQELAGWALGDALEALSGGAAAAAAAAATSAATPPRRLVALERLLQLLAAMLAERRVLVCAARPADRGAVVCAALALLAPWRWHHIALVRVRPPARARVSGPGGGGGLGVPLARSVRCTGVAAT
eukprot:COSAG01_NODE_299_length_19246_cov_62.028827_5_plen_217_part_00